MARVSVVIPNWNGAAMLSKALRCLGRQNHAIDEIIVVDNGSTDDSVSIAEQVGAKVIRFDQNRGFCQAVNLGVRSASCEWLVILNNDVEIGDNWLAGLMARAEACDTWFATGKLLEAEEPDLLDGAWDALCRGACAWRCGHARRDGAAWNTERNIRFAPFTALLVRAELFRRVGLLDETFESYLEDTDFGIRCALGGYSGLYVPEAVARHAGSATLGRWHKASVRRISRNQLLLVAKHFPQNWFLRLGWPVVVAQSLWGLLALRHRAGWAYLQGKADALRMFRRMRAASQSRSTVVSLILRESEGEIQQLQRQTGYDLYWRLYFALT